MPFKLLFSPGKIGKLKTKNRLVMPPMVRNYADENGLATKRYVEHIARIAKGGVGAMILEAAYVSPEGKGFTNQLGIHSDACVNSLRKLAKAAHDHKAVIGVQLYHAGRQTNPAVTGKQPVAPSPLQDPTEPEAPRELKTEEIKKLIKAFGAAAARAKKAGLDFIEIHGAHGYLITQFLSAYTNQRKDDWGGTPDKRFMFLQEVYKTVRVAVGPDFPVIVRLSGDEWIEGGITIKDTVSTAKRLEKLGADGLHITSGNYATYAQGKMIPPMAIEDGVLVPLAAEVKKAVKIPVMAVAKIRTPELAEKILKSKAADYVVIGRSLLADPDWPNKAKAGKQKEIMHCVACNQGCIARLFAQQDVRCTVNAQCGREEMFAKPVEAKKNVLVIGGGPAGLSAAKTAAQRGHSVTLVEREDELGGQLHAASLAPYRQEWEMMRKEMIRDVKKLKVKIQTGHAFTFDDLKSGKYDAAIVAVGSVAMRPHINGAEGSNVVIARDLFEGKAEAKGTIVVVGGGCLGAQTAEWLATKGHAVTMVELTDNVALESPIDERMLLLGRLEKLGVKSLTHTKVLDIRAEGVRVKKPDNQVTVLPAETVVMCVGAIPNETLAAKMRYMMKNVKTVGDAVKPRRITDAISEGALAALEI